MLKGENKTDLLEVNPFRLSHLCCSKFRPGWSQFGHRVQRAGGQECRMMLHIHLRRF
jgi:hypothetical protein